MYYKSGNYIRPSIFSNIKSFFIPFCLLLVISFVFTSTKDAHAIVTVNSGWINSNLSDGALFFDVSGETYRFETDYSANGTAIFVMANNITIDLNEHTINFGLSDRDGTIGIYPFAYRSQYPLGADDKNYSRTSSGGSGGSGTTVKNGRIIWGGTSGNWATGIGAAYAGSHVNIENVYVEVGGQDAAGVHFAEANVNIHDSYLLNLSTSTQNRHAGPATLKSEGKVVAYNNIIIGGNSAIVCGSNSKIYNNLLRHSAFATNGYGVWLYRMNGVTAYNNIIAPSNGRGILYNAGKNHMARDNIILAHEKPNAEYGSGLNPPALRMRSSEDHSMPDELENNEFSGNKCLVIGGNGLTAASGAYLSNNGGQVNRIINNEFRAILTSSPDMGKYANALSFEEQGNNSGLARDIIENNFLGSNNYIIRLTGYDGGCYQGAFSNNTLAWINGNDTYNWFVEAMNQPEYNFQYNSSNKYVTSTILEQLKNEVKAEIQGLISGVSDNKSRKTFFTGYWIYDAFITMLDTSIQGQVGMETSDVYVLSAEKSRNNIKIGHSLYILAKNQSGVPLANQNIVVSDSSGTYNTSTNSAGIAKLELIDYVLIKQNDSGAVTKEIRNGHTATISGQTYTLPLTIANNKDNPYLLGSDSSPEVGPPAKPTGLKIE